jgi:putative ABC transport system permease protein
MRRLALRNLRARRRRLVGTLVAVFLGVAFLSGTSVLSDTLRSSIDAFFVDATAGSDVIVRNATEVSDDADARRGPIPGSIVERVRAVDGVAAAEPVIEGFGQIVDRHGEALETNGPPHAGSWTADRDLNAWRIAEGRAPRALDEVAIDRGAATSADLHVGDRITVLTPRPVRVRVAGIARFAGEDSFGGSSYVSFTLAGAERHIAKRPGTISNVVVRAAPGLSPQQLVARIRATLPAGVEALAGSQLTSERQDAVSEDFLDAFSVFLTVFAVIALLVGALSISNTFSILVAQRTHESALLRAVGARRGQVVAMVALEALAVGVIASIAGVAGGVGLAVLLREAFAGLGFDLPARGLVLEAQTVAVAIPVGIVVTLLAATLPALRASRVAPLEALREAAHDATGGSRRRAVAGGLLFASGVAALLSGAIGGTAAAAGSGALLALIGVIVLGPVLAVPATRVLGAPLRSVTGRLARGNAARNPRRTAAAATALTIGVAVVALILVFASSMRASIDDSVSRTFAGDLAVDAGGFGGSGFSPSMAQDIAAVSGVRSAVGLASDQALVNGSSKQLTIADPAALASVVAVRASEGVALSALGERQIALSESEAEDRGLAPGDLVEVRFVDGASERFTVGALHDEAAAVGDYVLPRAAWLPHADQPLDQRVLIALAGGVDVGSARAAVERATRPYGAPDVEDRDGYIDAQTQQISALLGVVFVLLALAIVIALLGIANTLSLSIHERRRELGLLRIVGQTGRQLRRMVRLEALLVAAFGTVTGVVLGVGFGWALVQAVGAEQDTLATFSAPLGTLAIVLAVGTAAGILAAVRPARSAARTDPLGAVAAQ